MDDMKTTVDGLSSTVCFAGVVARTESLRGRMGESARQVEGCLRVCWRRVLELSPLCPLDISPKCDDSAVEFGGERGIEISYEN